MTASNYLTAANHLLEADGLLITAGAGMGIDSGLPDFRGPGGFWQVYPALGEARLAFEEIACPDTFVRSPELAWGFYGHRLNAYREARPHRGFAILQAIAARLPEGAFVFTSNVDGQFQQAGFPATRVAECHGSIHYLQCLDGCRRDRIWPATDFAPEVDEARCRLISPLPRCPDCGSLARPNVLMFGDRGWRPQRSEGQRERLDNWLQTVERLVVIELGAGTAIPTVRWFGEMRGAPLIRINPGEPDVASSRSVAIAAGALTALSQLEQHLVANSFLPNTTENPGND
ncbi:MAG TPA: Sir2 family NAD-dependent protein deacetylase [Azospira sp.]|nr:Sir2 family NAD-dependent protein deacetylase [Azospira sp.]